MPKKNILLSTAFFPPVSWFARLLEDVVFLEARENYQRQTYRNRCIIASERGILPLSVPVTRPKGNHTPIQEVQLFNGEKWYLKQWRAIRSAYQNSPYFLYYQDEIVRFFEGKYLYLWQLNWDIIHEISHLIGISPHIEITTSFEKKPENFTDLRHTFHPKKQEPLALPPYTQVFSDRYGFFSDLSILDLLFNLGPESKTYLQKVSALLPELKD